METLQTQDSVASVHEILPEAFGARLDRAAEAVRSADARALIVGPSVDLRYLTGLDLQSSDRPIILMVMPDQEPVLYIARIEADAAESIDFVSVLPYEEGVDPLLLVANSLQGWSGDGQMGVGDTMWASWLMRFQTALPSCGYFGASRLLGPMRMRKSSEEIRLLDGAAHLADAAFERLCQGRFAGRTEEDLAQELTGLLVEEGLQPANWGPIVASGPHTASPHHEPGDRIVCQGDAVLLDFGGVLGGYQADVTRTVHVGPANGRFLCVYETVRLAQDAAVRAVRQGISAQTVDAVARRVIEAAGFGDFFIHRTGHGVGLECHEEPYIIKGNELDLQDGMAFSVEPGIYIPGEFGVRIEDVVTVAQDEAQRLNRARHDLIYVA